MTKLTKVLKVQKMEPNGILGEETRTKISVDYNPDTYAVEVVSIEVETQKILCGLNEITYSSISSSADVTDLLLDNCPSMEKDILAMDWETEFREHKNVAA